MRERKSKSRELTTWDEKLAKEAEIFAAKEKSGGGQQIFSTQGGTLKLQDVEFPNDEMAVIILDAMFENIYYGGEKYDPDDPQPPVCFALNHDEDEMSPHENVIKINQEQANSCSDCEHNEWGSADTGRGKACKNTRRLAMIPCGKFDKDGEFEPFESAEDFESAGIAFMKLPATSITNYAKYIKQLFGALKRPPWAVMTRVALERDKKTQFKVTFEALDNVSDEFMDAVMQRREEAKASIDFPISLEKRDNGEGRKTASSNRRKNRRKY